MSLCMKTKGTKTQVKMPYDNKLVCFNTPGRLELYGCAPACFNESIKIKLSEEFAMIEKNTF
jgi:hypothetical protein